MKKQKLQFISVLFILGLSSLFQCNPFNLKPPQNLSHRFEEYFTVKSVPGPVKSLAMDMGGDFCGIVYVYHSEDISADILYFMCIQINKIELTYTIKNETILSSSEIIESADIVWTESAFGVVWSSYAGGEYDIWFCRIDSNGSLKSDPYIPDTTSTNNSFSPDIEWNALDNEYAVVFQEKNGSTPDSDIRLMLLDEGGIRKSLPSDIVAGSGSTSRNPEIVWNGTAYACTWEDNRDGLYSIYFLKPGSAGNQVVPAIITDCHRPQIVSTDTGYALVWYEAAGTVQYTELDIAGNPGTVVPIGYSSGYSSDPSIIWNGEECGILWLTLENGTQRIKFNLSPQSVSRDTVMFPAAGNSRMPQLAWSGSCFAAVWCGEESTGNRIFFAF